MNKELKIQELINRVLSLVPYQKIEIKLDEVGNIVYLITTIERETL